MNSGMVFLIVGTRDEVMEGIDAAMNSGETLFYQGRACNATGDNITPITLMVMNVEVIGLEHAKGLTVQGDLIDSDTLEIDLAA